MIEAEVLLPHGTNATGRTILKAIVAHAEAAGVDAKAVERYTGSTKWLVMWGVGAAGRSEIRNRHVRAGGIAALWDIGFFRRSKVDGHCKVSINDDYATRWLDRTEPDSARWDALGISLRDDFAKDGHIVLAGIGPKQHDYMRGKIDTWERDKLNDLRRRFPGKRIVYRPKPNRPYITLPAETNARDCIEDVLRGASLAVCHHSNVAIDAVLAGVPFESDDGVSTWLRGKPYTYETRLGFCRRIARWQYKAGEMTEAWTFLRGIVGQLS